jgi:uncharacterized phiE125 gp8 family phage protein
MTLLRTVAPVGEPVSLSEAKVHLRLTTDSEDALLEGLIRAAREDVERATGLALIDQDWRMTMDAIPPDGTVAIRRCPLKEVLAVTIYGSEGEARVVNPDDYSVDVVSRPARVVFHAMPALSRTINGVEIDFRAGYGEAGTDVPDLLRRAILTLAAHWFEFRSAYGPGDQPVSYPQHYERLIAPFRDRRL